MVYSVTLCAVCFAAFACIVWHIVSYCQFCMLQKCLSDCTKCFSSGTDCRFQFFNRHVADNCLAQRNYVVT